MPISVEFKKRINELANEEGLSKADLKNQIGISADSVSRTTNYGIVPRLSVLMKIADYFDVSVEYLLGRTDNFDFDKAETPSSFRKRVEELRKARNVTYYQICKSLHFEESYFSRWKAKNHLPSLELLILLAEYFDVSLDYLLGRTEQ